MKYFLPVLFTVLISFNLSAQNSPNNWSKGFTQQKVFIENKGQWNGLNNLPGSEVLFASDYSHFQILFTKKGLTYRLSETKFPNSEEREEREEKMKDEMRGGKMITHEELEKEENRTIRQLDYVQMQWENSNPAVQIVAEESVSHYYNYCVNGKGVDHVKAYQKLVYKNLYPGIDVEYIFHPKGGIEYSFILHPGADASQIKMKYSDKVIKDSKGNLLLPNLFGNIIEHAPKTFIRNNNNKSPLIASQFVCSGNEATFVLGAYDKSQTVVIDPWVQSPAFASQWDCVWECEKDGAGNAYLIGGVTPMQLLKYNSTGTLQWTYSTPYDTTSWLGTFAVDNAGNSYVTQGSIAAIQKISTAGALVWSNPNPGGIFSSTEFWSISFNCDQTKLVIGGTGNILPPQPYVYQVDMTNGNVTSNIRVTDGALFPTEEVRSITACGNGKYYFMTHDSIGYLNQNFGLCSSPQQAKQYFDNTYHLGYKCENFRYNNTGIEAIKTYGGFVYVNRGNRLDKRNFTTGAIIASVAIPGGAFTTSFGSSFNENSGIDIDNCGNIYVGSKGQVVKFDQSLTQLATYPCTTNGSTQYNVYDVEVSTGGNIIAAGSTGTSGSGARTGAIQSIAAGACSPVAITCCDASICQMGPYCTTDGPVSLTASTPGVWSGTGITNSATGVFNPTTAGQGTHYVVNTIGCGSDSIAITVNICASLSACLEQNGSITVSGGSGPYKWYQQDTVQNCSSCLFGCFIPPGCATTTYSWVNFATGPTEAAPEFPVRILDVNNNELLISNTTSLPACSITCTLAASATPTSTTCGSNNGSATVTATGGTPSGYAWSNGGNAASISNVAAGSYTVTVTSGGCTATASAVVAASSGVTATASSTNASCGANNGSATITPGGGNGSFTYLWSNGGTGATISNVAAATYTVTVTSGSCTASSSATVNNTNGVTTTTSSTNAGCSPTGSATVTPSGGNGSFTYLWSNGGTGATISNVAAGAYMVTVTSAGCTATASVTVTQTGTVTSSTSSTNAGCSPTGSATVTPSGGNGSFTYLWSNGGTGATVSNVAAGTYTVTVTSAGCTATASVTVTAVGSVTASTSTTNAGCTSTGSATATPSGGNGSFTYLWSNGGTGATISNISGGNYTVTVTSGNCTATAVANVISTGGVTLSSSSTNTTCGNSNGGASVTATTGSAPFTYLWSNGGTNPSISNVAGGTYTVTVNDGSTCTATASIIVSASTVTPALITTTDSLICSGDSAQICVTGTYASYSWNTGQTTQCIYAKQAGNYYVTATDNSTCTVSSNRIPLSVYPSPPVSISVNGDTLTAYNAVTYQWYLNNNLIPGATSNVYIALQSGDYSIVVTDTNGCHATSTKVSVIKTGIFSLGKEEVVKIYPNPLESGYWNLEVGNSLIGAWVEVFDADGRLVYKSEIGNLKSEINLHVASGVYMMRISSNTSNVTHKLIKL